MISKTLEEPSATRKPFTIGVLVSLCRPQSSLAVRLLRMALFTSQGEVAQGVFEAADGNRYHVTVQPYKPLDVKG